MAASLLKSLAGLCTRTQPAARVFSHAKAVLSSHASQPTTSLVAIEQAKLYPNLTVSGSSVRGIHLSAICCTTPEMKRWREHRVIDRFYRLPWGAWIRTQGGRRKSLYKRHPRRRWQLKQHIFCNYHQNKLLDKLVTSQWKEPKYYPDSPYEPYNQRTNSFWQPNHRKFYP